MEREKTVTYSNVKNITSEEAKAILTALIEIRKDADEYNWEAARQDPSRKYLFHSAAEKFGYDAWKYLEKQCVLSEGRQQLLPI